ncbi:hypothetical protein NM688_g4408 [Phlebia brevispora]|uniref:Uncharacterized protein n=1 Tax=Phlebia brevispora TaxID=194682 RepID=A0ACC1T3D7_9APHY|nr:hypothetical protein NM688_g4408 [Phlebia brevispora]
MDIIELLHLILSFADKATLSHCALVCKFWHTVAFGMLWADALDDGIRPLLWYIDTFRESTLVDPLYKMKQIEISRPPSPTSWVVFEERAGPYICSLTLDLKSLACSQEFLDMLRDSCLQQLHLPKLWKLKVIVNQTETELEIAIKFMQPTVKHLSLDIWEPLPFRKRDLRTMQREAEVHIPFYRVQFTDAPSPHPLLGLFETVVEVMPNLTELEFAMRDHGQMLSAWPAFINLCTRLKDLHTVRLPPYVLTETSIWGLIGHPSLRRLVACARTWTKTSWMHTSDVFDVSSLDMAPNRSAAANLTDISITILPTQVESFLRRFEVHNITSLHINCGGYVYSAYDVVFLFGAVAEACPLLEDLKVGPLTGPPGAPLRLSYKMLRPLTRCAHLTSLDVRTTHTSVLNDDEFTSLLLFWRRLRKLTLDYPDVACSSPQEIAELSLPAAMLALQLYCGKIREYGRRNFIPPLLEQMSLIVGYPDMGQAEKFVQYTDQLFPSPADCIPKLYTAGCKCLGLHADFAAWNRRRSAFDAFTSRLAAEQGKSYCWPPLVRCVD